MTTTTGQSLSFDCGDVVLVLFPNSGLRSAKTRPALVIQRDNLKSGLRQFIVCMITSRRFRAHHPSRVAILLDSPGGRQSGLLGDSVVMTDNIATITSMAMARVVGNLAMLAVDKALRHTLAV